MALARKERARGRKSPLDYRVDPWPELRVFWDSFWALSGRRASSLDIGSIPISEMEAWGRIVLHLSERDLSEFVILISAMDDDFVRLCREKSTKAQGEPRGKAGAAKPPPREPKA